MADARLKRVSTSSIVPMKDGGQMKFSAVGDEVLFKGFMVLDDAKLKGVVPFPKFAVGAVCCVLT